MAAKKVLKAYGSRYANSEAKFKSCDSVPRRASPAQVPMPCALHPQVASATNDVAGDGTTTATVLTRAILVEGCKSVAAGMNPMDLRRGINLAVSKGVACGGASCSIVGLNLMDPLRHQPGGERCKL